MGKRCPQAVLIGALLIVFGGTVLRADEPKAKPENTLSISVEPVKPQTFPSPVKFFLDKVVDRSGNPQPMMVFKPRGGVFIDREPTAIVREAVEVSLKGADMLVADKDSANYVLDIYIFHFGLGESSGLEFFGKVDLNIVVKDRASGKSETISAMGTSIRGTAVRKKNMMKNMEANLEGALQDGLRNFLRGAKLRSVVLGFADTQAAASRNTPDSAATPNPQQGPVAPNPQQTPPPR